LFFHPSSFPFGFSFQPLFLVALLAEFPDDALGAKFAVPARVRARLAVLQAFPAIADLHLLAFDIGLSVCVKATLHVRTTSYKKCKFSLSNPAVSTMKRTNKSRGKMQ
jgi:hypothetical protein